jgi:sulfofructose kinase
LDDTARPLVICLGNAVADHVFRVDEIPQPPAKERARGYALTAGGMAANAAIAVRRLGGRAVFWGRVGDDSNGELLLRALRGEGVETSDIRVIEGAVSPTSAVLVDKQGERVILGFRGERLDPDPAWLPLGQLREARALLCDPRWVEGAERAYAAAEELGIETVLDGERSETRVLLNLVPRVRHAIFSVPGLANYATGLRPTDALRKAVSEGVTRLAAVTRGEQGVLWLRRGEETPHHTPAFPVAATNTTGAGDVFHGAYALALAEGMELEAAMRLASAAGALRARDGRTAARAETEALLAGQG